MNEDVQAEVKTTPVWLVCVFWLYVLIPLTWGVWSTVMKALALFK